ncbi:wax ester/triacylglycerol synthase domain-containing protein [Streptomyces albireticuli]|uniref:wax ester/triacylglycerol synthase domain-containing protein n=1 Tax=Streptomyces albireticuli TaxID=1940 RepID=UPI0013314143|nr:wax ester/triacylglycerol synthase domain-containing protein [Streptomyces albireticuli]
MIHLTGQAPSLDRLAAHLRQRLDRLPALSLTMRGQGTAAVWCSQSPELDHHLRVHEVPIGADIYDAVRELHHAPFTEGRPPWTMTLLHGHTPGHYAIVYLINHGLQDGGGIIRTLEVLFAHPAVDAASSSATVRTLCVPSRPSPRHYAQAAALLARSVKKSPLWPHPRYGYSTERVFHWAGVPTKLLRDLAGPFGGSSNDAFLATLARVASRWAVQRHPGYEGNRLPVTLAINNRRPAVVDLPGNRATGGRLDLPGHIEPLGQSLRSVVAATGLLKQAPCREAIRRLSENIPPSLLDRSFRSLLSPERAEVFSSHFAIRHELGFAGDPVHAIDPITVLPLGSPVSVLMISYQGQSRTVFVTDPALPDADRLHQEWRAEVVGES